MPWSHEEKLQECKAEERRKALVTDKWGMMSARFLLSVLLQVE